MKEFKLTHKSKYMIYNNDTLTIKDFECIKDAKEYAVNYCDHSQEIIVRKIGFMNMNIKLRQYVKPK